MRNVMILFIIAAGLVSGCGGNPQGSVWMTADFNKYDKNYADFKTDGLRTGITKSEVTRIIGANYKVVEKNSSGAEILAFDKWVSVSGPDYVSETLYVVMRDDKLDSWSISSDVTSIVPRSW